MMLQFSQKRFVAWGTHHTKGEGVDLLLVKKGFSAIKIFEFMLDNFYLFWLPLLKVIVEKSRGEGSLMEQNTIENVS